VAPKPPVAGTGVAPPKPGATNPGVLAEVLFVPNPGVGTGAPNLRAGAGVVFPNPPPAAGVLLAVEPKAKDGCAVVVPPVPIVGGSGLAAESLPPPLKPKLGAGVEVVGVVAEVPSKEKTGTGSVVFPPVVLFAPKTMPDIDDVVLLAPGVSL